MDIYSIYDKIKKPMIPLRDDNPSGKTPIITYLLIGLNSLVFISMLGLSQFNLKSFYEKYALTPAFVTSGHLLYTLLTSMFLHGSFGHIIGNMLFLNIFGDNIEAAFGRIKFLIFYLICGLGASFLQIITDPTSTIPNLGASGAIAGVMGAYLVLFPRNEIEVLYDGFGFSRRGTVPAYSMLFYWFIAQLFGGVGSLAVPGAGGIAFFAHVGGFVTGVIVAKVYKKIKSI